MSLLQTEKMSVTFGGLRAVNEVDFAVTDSLTLLTANA